MGRKLDALLGRNFKIKKFRNLTKLAISRIGILKKQHQVRYFHARSDVIELLNLGHQERALHRVEYVIKEENMVDAFTMMESYFNLLIERVMLIQKNRECPDELKEATSSLMFASSRCSEFPELLHIREVLSSTFGKEFVARSIELRNNCGVHPKIIQKLLTRQPSLESKMKVLKQIASESNITITLQLKAKQDESIANKSGNFHDRNPPHHIDTANDLHREVLDIEKKLSTHHESIKAKKEYRDVATAAQEAFESAAYAAAAARAAVELSRTEPSQDFDSDDDDESGLKRGRESFDESDSDDPSSEENDHLSNFEKIHPIDNSPYSEPDSHYQNEIEEIKQKLWLERTLSTSSSDSEHEDI